MNSKLIWAILALLMLLGITAGVKHLIDKDADKGAVPSGEQTTAAPDKGAGGAETPPAPKAVEQVTIIDGKTNTVVEVAPPVRQDKRRPLEPEATKRLHEGPVIVSSLFEASGKGEYAQYGGSFRGSYLYTTTVMAQSEILDKSEDEATGRILVTERRKFLQSRDNLSLSEIDAAIALDTLPVGQVQDYVGNTCHLVSALCTAISPVIPPAAPWLTAAAGGVETANLSVKGAFAALSSIDGQSARGLLGAFGVEIPQNLDEFVNNWLGTKVNQKIASVHNAVQSIEGKSFIVTYEQEKNGSPLNVDYKSEDGLPITDAEWEILRNVNAFLDANIVPDTRCRVGDSWTVWADELQELFGAAGDGRADGKIRVERVGDQPDGAWTLKVEPSEIGFRSSNGTAAGSMKVKDGNGLVDAENASVKSLHVTASGSLQSLNKKRHLLFFDFVKRIGGDSNLRFTLTVEPAKSR